MVPVLQFLADGALRHRREISRSVADATRLTEQQRSAILASGEPVYENRVGWALSYLTRVGALARPQRSHYQCTELGRSLLREHPTHLSEADIRPFARPGDEWWIKRGASENKANAENLQAGELDPTEQVEEGIRRIREGVKVELLSRLLDQDAAFFERAVVKLLVSMGYGGTGGVATVTNLVGDGGIDGVIDQDVLGLSKVFVQAKRYAQDRAVQRPEVQAFVGALSGKAEQGVFITPGRFSSGAKEYAERDARVRIILVDGAQLAELMIRFGVGVQVKQTHHIVAIDEDFFE